ncbi:hypothetical protein N482_24405 [Pseudoalteromonas luteoviolacea NCIMB 1942]|uniref:Mannan-binding protein domain-containing protein n=2 Tax=Pseudoalteromonas luteoviolacea TaxID=43657 RepID=A0A167GAG3_9GAMM|nr:hypothetical protein N482_24405 [Pseudoalteromonas luteoviolacea NCIMB 1942]
MFIVGQATKNWDIEMKTPSRKLIFTSVIALSIVQLTACYNSASTRSDTTASANTYVQSVPANTYDCQVDPNWITSPSFPQEVKKSGADGSSNFCDFYQFSTQAYLYLMSPSSENSALRNFQVDANYPLLEFNDDTLGSPANSCDNIKSPKSLRTSLQKSSISTGQAGGGASIYAQDGNVVYYDVRFNKSLCDLSASAVELGKKGIINFPSGTTELKFAWKVLSEREKESKSFVTQQQMIDGQPQTLGLLGMHIAVATEDHPEFVWATYEYKANSPTCDAQGEQAMPWLFAEKTCTAGLPDSLDNELGCKFNQPELKNGPATGTPTNICVVYPYGTASGDHKAGENLANIVSQNANLYDALSTTHASSAMQRLNNYFNVGAIWVSDTTSSSGGIGVPNERGSLRLANSVAETDFQHVNLNNKFSSNCFGCHEYSGTGQKMSNNITSQKLSHSFIDIVTGQGKAADVNAISQITSNEYAALICGGDPKQTDKAKRKGTCKNARSYLKWNGNWTNINTSAGSVCGCEVE